MSLLNIGVSGLRAQQAALEAASVNVANANTPGYSRQRVELERPAGGLGVDISQITRVTNQQLLGQVRFDRAAASASETLTGYLDQLDNILSTGGTSLSPAIGTFFTALDQAATDPESATARSLVLESANGLERRFADLQRRLDEVQIAVDSEIDVRIKTANELIRGIADLNVALTAGGSNPNAILDNRERLAGQLANEIGINVQFEGDQMRVLANDGTPLVLPGLAGSTFQLAVTGVPGGEISVLGPGANREITERIGGGALAALVEFRDGSLALADNELGRVAVVLAEEVNAQHARGLTADGEFGEAIFEFDTRAGEPPRLVAHEGTNEPPQLELAISDVNELRPSSYTLAFDSVDENVFRITRDSDGSVVLTDAQTGSYPLTVTFDGLSLTFPAGGFTVGDRYEFSAVTGRGGLLDRGIDKPEKLALAGAVAAQPAATNRGSAEVLAAQGLDAERLADLADGTRPPLVVRFADGGSYEILDATDPFRPQPLLPPLRGLPFSPGVPNELMPAPGSTGVFSDGAAIGQLAGQAVTATPTAVGNGYPGETIAVNRRDSSGALLATTPVVISPDASAREIAAALNAVDGVRADARTTVRLANLNDDGNGEPLTVYVNGQAFDGAGSVLSADRLVQGINADESLAAAGISARVLDGEVEIQSARGDDISIAVGGDAGDSVDVRAAGTATLTGQGAGLVAGVTVGGDVAVILDEGVNMRPPAGSSLFGSPAVSVDLGLSLVVAGEPQARDTVDVGLNTTPEGDNRNALALASLVSAATVEGRDSFSESFERMSGAVASRTQQARIASEADASIVAAAEAALGSVAGVNLDEEAADLVRFEQYYNASARVVAVGRSLFDSLLGIFN